MKRFLSLAALLALLGGCAVIPVPVDGGGERGYGGYDDRHHGHGHRGWRHGRHGGYRH